MLLCFELLLLEKKESKGKKASIRAEWCEDAHWEVGGDGYGSGWIRGKVWNVCVEKGLEMITRSDLSLGRAKGRLNTR